ncbi:MAG: YihY/virulence factor BrkB family protein [Actinomycetota bacterium]|nr:YihY/virulence factor BrkB family protein [Actinomycetota bacterium]
MNPVERVVRQVDGFQQSHRPLAIGFGVIKKFGDDRAGSLAALIAYYGFLAIFPLLLLLTTALGFAMDRNSDLKESVLRSALRDFPIVGQQLGQAIHPLQGNLFALTVGVVGLVWGSLGVTQAGQLAMAEVWNVPGVARPPFVSRLLRGLGLLCVLGGGIVATTVIASLSAFGGGVALKVAGVALSVALNIGLFAVGFRVLTVRSVATRSLLPGAILGGVGWSVLQVLGAYLVGHQLRHASQVYGYFASVLGLVSWLFLGAQLTLYAAEANVVWARQLWPRSIVQPPLTDADKRAFDDIALQGERRPEQSVKSIWDDDATASPSDPESTTHRPTGVDDDRASPNP